MKTDYTQNINAAESSRELQRMLKQMEKDGVSLLDRTQAAVDFIDGKKKNSAAFEASSERAIADEDLAKDDDAETSGADAVRSGPQADTNGPTSGPDAVGSGQNANTSGQKSNPELPPPPKFQFGPGNDLYDIALDFHAFRDKRSILDRLSDNLRRAIYKLMDVHSERDVIDLLAKLPPAGLGIRVGRSTLVRFRKRYQKQVHLRKKMAFQLECNQLLEATGNDDQAFLRASERLLKLRLFDITGDPAASTETIAGLADVIVKLRKQSLAERKHVQSSEDESPEEPATNPSVSSKPPAPASD
jgi:hypothetical protein